MRRIGLILAALFFLLAPLFGQYNNHLILRKGYRNRVHFLVGDSIRFQYGNSQNGVAGIIDGIGEEILVLGDSSYHVKAINSVTVYRTSFNYKSGGRMLQVASPGFLAIAGTNALLQDVRPVWSTGNLITAGTLFATGTLLTTMQTRKFRLGNRFNLKLVIIDQ